MTRLNPATVQVRSTPEGWTIRAANTAHAYTAQMIPAAEALVLHALVTPVEQGIASRVVAKTTGT